MTRGERNNNPFNINFIAAETRQWKGQIGIEIVPPDENYMPRFGRYSTAILGIRAGMKQLLHDQANGCDTIQKLVNSWAPSSDNNQPLAYAAAVAKEVGVVADAPVNLEQPIILLLVSKGFILVENGRCIYDDATMRAACNLALQN